MCRSARPVFGRSTRIDEALRGGTWSNSQTFARKLEVHPRTIRRDFDYLRDCLGALVEIDAKRRGDHYTEPSYRLPFLRLAEGEFAALFLTEQMLRPYHGAPYSPDLARAFDKIIAGLNDRISVEAESSSRAISFRTIAPAVFDASILKTFIEAILQHRRVVIDYSTASRHATAD